MRTRTTVSVVDRPGATPAHEEMTWAAMTARLKVVAVHRAEEALHELPRVVRAFRRLLVAATIAAGVVVVLAGALVWHVVH